MRLRWIAAIALGLVVPAPAGATLVEWRAHGVVASVQGTASLLPLPAAPGDDFVIEFSYDEGAVDSQVSPDHASYPIVAMTVTIDGQSLDYVGAASGEGHVSIQANAIAPNSWGVTGYLTSAGDPLLDEARLNFFFPASTILSDTLTDPPDPTGASIQFGLFSRDLPAAEEAFVVATLEAVVAAPEPGAAGSLAAGAALAATGVCRGRRRVR